MIFLAFSVYDSHSARFEVPEETGEWKLMTEWYVFLSLPGYAELRGDKVNVGKVGGEASIFRRARRPGRKIPDREAHVILELCVRAVGEERTIVPYAAA